MRGLQTLLEIPGDLGITTVDVEKDPALARIADGRSELVGLALWLMKELAKVSDGYCRALQLNPWSNSRIRIAHNTNRVMVFDLLGRVCKQHFFQGGVIIGHV